MNRETVQAIAIAAMGTIAVAVAAATLDDLWNPDTPRGDTGGGGERPLGPPPAPDHPEGVEIPYVDEILMFLALVVAILGAIYLVLNYRKVGLMILGLVGFTGLLLLIGEALDVPFPEPREAAEGTWNLSAAGENGQSAPPDAHIDWLPVMALLAIFGIAVVAALALSIGGSRISLGRSSGDATRARNSDAVASEIGAVAGRAADRIESSDAYENEVYRAWVEMTGLFDMSDPELATPGDFAATAIDTGLSPADVEDLTELFEIVRYGDRPPTPEREQQAIDLLRRIENRYAEVT